ncbi:MAG: glutaminase [Betaproteobacteria bacterium]|nr:glutaminase [Betaproteobacteria bacterium]
MDYQRILDRVHAAVKPIIGTGNVASYIPELAKVSPAHFGIAIVDLEGQVYRTGDAEVPFSIQSISKLFGLTLAFHLEGDSVWTRVGREPSGTPFNSLVQLEQERGRPRNPFINAGALVVTDILFTHYAARGGAENALIKFIRKLADRPDIGFDRAVAESERRTSHRNAAMANFMKSFGNLNNDVNDVLEAYCRHCAIEMSCVDLARAVTFLANHGVVPWSREEVLDKSSAKRISALMLTCGTYDAAGDFAYRVGLPAKSGVGGGIVALMPGECGICVWSPALEASGNSYAGSIALEMLTSLSGRSIF